VCGIWSATIPRRETGNSNLESKLGNTDWPLETGPLVDVGLEAIDRDVVVMDGNLIDVAVSTALVEECCHPIKAIGIGAGARGTKGVTFIDERP
jgi:hypothetical protein